MMELEQALRDRRSIRHFRPEPPSRELLRALVTLATLAPSAMNRQDWLFTVITAGEARVRVAALVRQEWDRLGRSSTLLTEPLASYAANLTAFAEAPVLILVSARRPPSFLVETLGPAAERFSGGATSAAMAAQNLLLAAQDRGLGTCVFTGPVAAEEAVLKLVGLGRSQALVCLVALGWPAEEPGPRPRKAVDEVLRFLDDPA